MKRLVLSLLFSMLGAFFFLGLHVDDCQASAYGSQPNILYTETAVLTESMIVTNGYRDVAGLSGLQAGDHMVSFMIQNNNGYVAMGIRYTMDNSYYEPYLVTSMSGIDIAKIPGAAASNMNIEFFYIANQDLVALSLAGSNESYNDGALVSFFMKRKQNAPTSAVFPAFESEVIGFVNQYNEDQEYTEVQPAGEPPHSLVTYMIGDIDGDGEVTAYDSSVLMTVINSTNATLTAANAQTYFDYCVQTYGTNLDGMYPQNVFVFDVADLNQDGVIDSYDSGLILSYFSFITAGLDPELNPAIAHLGTTGYYVA